MGSSVEKQEAEWYDSFPHRGAIYDQLSIATSGAVKSDRLGAVVALGKSDDPRAVRPLMDLLEDPDPEIRIEAVVALGLLKSGRSVEALIGRLQDRGEQAGIRKQAAAALCSIRSTGAIRGLKEFATDEDEDPAIRDFVAGVISRIVAL